MGVKVSPRELGAFRSAARSLPVATWIRSRALEALEARGPREQAESFLGQARALRDRADEVLGELDRQFRRRIAAVDRLLAKVRPLRGASGPRVRRSLRGAARGERGRRRKK